MSLRLSKIPMVVVSSPEMAQQILQMHDHAFTNHMPIATANNVFEVGMDIVFSQPNTYWKLMGRIFAAEMASPKGMQFFKPMRVEETRLLMQSVLADCKSVQNEMPQSQALQLRTKLKGATSDIMMRMMICKRFSELSRELQGARV
ncbi:hypothetical protein L7F22_008471 [Adiantum nelumboides]|nr:hypothetical protein [Adiantum nelumboides]